MTDSRPLRVAIVGSGPSGMYAAGHLLEGPGGTFLHGRLEKLVDRAIEVDVFDRLPTPWGLIRGGVAPDHPDKKRMGLLYDTIARRPGFRFFGNVNVGIDLTPDDLSAWYDAVIYAVGAEDERRLGIPGEELPGSHSARQFVGWYNGHPDFSALEFDLDTERAVIIGNGNVAMDVARILLKPVDELRQSDIAEHALDTLATSRIREVVILGRRGPEHAAFNYPELMELGELPDTAIQVEGQLGDEDSEAAKQDHLPANQLKQAGLAALCADKPTGSRRILFRFHASPTAIAGDGRVARIQLSARAGAGRALQPMSLETGLVLAAIGYRGRAPIGLPFDEARAVVPSHEGRVLQGSNPLPGAFVTGWIRRGPRGIIGSNKKCARDCVRALLADAAAGRLLPAGTLTREAVLVRLTERVPAATGYAGWLAIDRQERSSGLDVGRPRIKLAQMADLLRSAGQQSPHSPHAE